MRTTLIIRRRKLIVEIGGGDSFAVGDIRDIKVSDLPDRADLAWASFPCQDLSLAGGGAGLKGERSGTFWPFWKLISEQRLKKCAPKIIVLENVTGTLSSHGGKDFNAICEALRKEGYSYGALVIDAVQFVPQSRPRLFVVAVSKEIDIPFHLTANSAPGRWTTRGLLRAYANLSKSNLDSWVWWDLGPPPRRNTTLIDLIEKEPTGVTWHSHQETQNLLSMMSDINLAKVHEAKRAG